MINYFNALFRILAGLFIPNKHYSVPLQIAQIISRFTWELPQTLLGLVSSLFYAIIARVRHVYFSNGVTVLQTTNDFGGFSLGNYIVGNAKINGNPSQRLFQHEYGHYVQSMSCGFIYIFKYGLPSLISSYRHDFYGHCVNPVEQDANIRAKKYWDKYYQQNYVWDSDYNPIYKDIKPATLNWYDFMPVYFPLVHLVKAFKK